MDAAQTNVDHAHASRTGTARSIQISTIHQGPWGAGADAPFKGLRVHSTQKCQETGGNFLPREETSVTSPDMRAMPKAPREQEPGAKSFAIAMQTCIKKNWC